MEAIGAVSAILAVGEAGAKLAESTHKLVKLARDIRKFPKRIDEWISYIEAEERLLLSLCDVYNQDAVPSGEWEASEAKKYITETLEVLRKMKDFGKDLLDMMRSRRGLNLSVGTIQAFSKKSKVASLEDEFNRTRKRMEFAIQAWAGIIIPKYLFRESLEKLKGELICATRVPDSPQGDLTQQHLTTTKSLNRYRGPSPSQPKSFGLITQKTGLSSSYGQAEYETTSDGWTASLRLWQKALEVQYHRGYGLSNLTLQTYNVVSESSIVFTTVKSGDVAGMLTLFASRQASPFDRDQNGFSLLYHATSQEQVAVCEELLRQGCSNMIDDRANTSKESAFDVSLFKQTFDWNGVDRFSSRGEDAKQLQYLFRRKLQGPHELSTMRLLDFFRQGTYDEEYVVHVREGFMKEFYDVPLIERLEVFRFGSFHARSTHALVTLLNHRKFSPSISADEVAMSVRGHLSLVHSAAIALGKRYRGNIYHGIMLLNTHRPYNDAWHYLVVDVARGARPEDLHSIETVTPWADYNVRPWTGTPLISLLGGALCRISATENLKEWKRVMKLVLRQWLDGLTEAGVDLMDYGRRETQAMEDPAWDYRGAFGAEAQNAHSLMDQRRMVPASRGEDERDIAEAKKTVGLPRNPIRLTRLKYGPKSKDWKLWWKPEYEAWAGESWWEEPDYEAWAGEFWESISRPMSRMPGEWEQGW